MISRILLFALLLSTGATAQQPAKPAREATIGGGTGTGPTLTREQLRVCLNDQDTLKTDREAVLRDKATLDAEKDELQRAGDALKARSAAVDQTNADALKALVEEGKAHEQRVEAWATKLPAFNERAQALNARNETWKTDCSGRRYREDDLLLLQGRRQVPQR